MNLRLLIVFGFLISIGAILFTLQNMDLVTLKMWQYQFESSLALLLMAAFGLGFLLALVLMIPPQLVAKTKILTLKLKVKGLENKLDKKEAKVEDLSQKVEAKTNEVKKIEQEVKQKEKNQKEEVTVVEA